MYKYYWTAAWLGIGWFAVLGISPATSRWVISGPGGAGVNFALLVVASVITARLFRKPIVQATRFREHALRAAIIPYAGCLVYLTVYNVVYIVPGASHWRELINLYLLGLGTAIGSAYTVVPYGFVCQIIMHRVGVMSMSRI